MSLSGSSVCTYRFPWPSASASSVNSSYTRKAMRSSNLSFTFTVFSGRICFSIAGNENSCEKVSDSISRSLMRGKLKKAEIILFRTIPVQIPVPAFKNQLNGLSLSRRILAASAKIPKGQDIFMKNRMFYRIEHVLSRFILESSLKNRLQSSLWLLSGIGR